ncbi:MAG: SRPBCC family protein [Actinomycetota bacterium]|nr:SRPBCC family protein [Actinomycetota bacterium]
MIAPTPGSGDADDLTTGSATVSIDAPAATVWELVSDISRMGQWSPENVRSEWLTAGKPAAASRFRGHNELGDLAWTSDCEVVDYEPHHAFSFRTIFVDIVGGESFDTDDDSTTTWRYEIRSAPDGGVTLTESFHQQWLADPDSIPNQLGERQRALIASCQATLERIKQAAENKDSR